MQAQEEHVASETLRVDDSQGRTVNDSVGAAISRVYELQLIAIGMILAKPSLLKGYESKNFCDAEIHSLMASLKSNSPADSKRSEIEKFLGDRGVEPYVARGLDSLDGVRERIVVDSQYCRALSYIVSMVNSSGSVRSKDKLDFVETLKNAQAGMD